MTLKEMARQMLIDRGLGYDHTQPNQMDVPTSVQIDDGMFPSPLEFPWDYEARAEALRCAVNWSASVAGPLSKEQTLQRAIDFHRFLIGKETPEDGNDE